MTVKTKKFKNAIDKKLASLVDGFIYADVKNRVVCENFEDFDVENLENLKTELIKMLREGAKFALRTGEDYIVDLAIADELDLDMNNLDIGQLADEGED